jgi:hypothetical protein
MSCFLVSHLPPLVPCGQTVTPAPGPAFLSLSRLNGTASCELGLIKRRVILPLRNRKDVQNDLPESLRNDMSIEFVGTVEELLEEVWGKDVWSNGQGIKLEARL